MIFSIATKEQRPIGGVVRPAGYVLGKLIVDDESHAKAIARCINGTAIQLLAGDMSAPDKRKRDTKRNGTHE